MIRPATIQDAKAIGIASQALGYKETSVDFTEKQIQSILDLPDNFILVFEEDNNIKGWIHFFVAHRVSSPTFVEIGGLAVHSNHQRSGIGGKLVNLAFEWATEKNYKIRVRCNSKRHKAHSFYNSLGFLKAKDQYVYEKEFLNE